MLSKKELSLFDRHMCLLTMNDAHRKKVMQGLTINIDNYYYFDYNENEKLNFLDRVYALAINPIYTTGMGEPKFLFNMYGLTIKDLCDMDYKTFLKIEEDAKSFGEMVNKKQPPNKYGIEEYNE